MLIIAIGASGGVAKHAKPPGPLYEQPPPCNHDEVSIFAHKVYNALC